jgi:hypothetical protein
MSISDFIQIFAIFTKHQICFNFTQMLHSTPSIRGSKIDFKAPDYLRDDIYIVSDFS